MCGNSRGMMRGEEDLIAACLVEIGAGRKMGKCVCLPCPRRSCGRCTCRLKEKNQALITLLVDGE